MITKTVHIIILMIIIIFSITVAVAARTVFARFETTYEGLESMRDFKTKNTKIVLKIQEIYDKFNSKQYSSISTLSGELKTSINSAFSSCEKLESAYNDQTDENYFSTLKYALKDIRDKYNSPMLEYITEEDKKKNRSYSTIQVAFNTNNFIKDFKNYGIYYDQMCRDVYNILESRLSKTVPIQETVNNEQVNVERTFNLPRQFYCRYNPKSTFL